jgi:hypothetical protein
MSNAVKLYKALQKIYGNTLPFRQICEDEKIIYLSVDLDPGINGMYVCINTYKAILLNNKLKKVERYDWAFHELYHHFMGVKNAQVHYAIKEECCATLFAALCRIPIIQWGDTLEWIVELYGVSPWLAKARIEYEQKELLKAAI